MRAAAKQPEGSGYADQGPTIAQGSGNSCSRVRRAERLVSFLLCTPGDISILRRQIPHRADRAIASKSTAAFASRSIGGAVGDQIAAATIGFSTAVAGRHSAVQ